MDSTKFEIVGSTKEGLVSNDSFLVIRHGISYLRLLGQEPCWELWTATASEDDGSVQVCGDRLRLIEAAARLCIELGTTGLEAKDRSGKDYIKICRIARSVQDENLDEELSQVVERFFELFDELGQRGTDGTDELADLYNAISSGDSSEDVYLSDGVWLSSDGGLHDRGR